jgi:UDPglucose 6-dehydrogenase
MNVCVVGGAGYVGLVTGVGLAQIGHQVIAIDIDSERVHALNAGQSPIYDEGIDELLARNVESGRIRFTTDFDEAVAAGDFVFVAVGTPSQADGQADLSQVIQVAEGIRPLLDRHKIVVLKSTVPVGTMDLVRKILSEGNEEGRDFDIVSNPEFLREGKAVRDFFEPDRIVIGASSADALKAMRDLYAPLINRDPAIAGITRELGIGGDAAIQTPIPVVETDVASAQMIKYASNAFLATRISFINEVAWICERVGADVREVSRGMGYDPRIGHAYLQAGLGFGGPCLDKDTRALIKIAEGNGYEPGLLRSVLERNERQVEDVVAKVKFMIGHLLYHRTIAVFGLTFKAGTNDLRDSLAVKVVSQLRGEGANVRAHDPMDFSKSTEAGLDTCYTADPYEAVTGADALMILTDWPEFLSLDYERIRGLMTSPAIVDARNMLDAAEMASIGFSYVGIGKGPASLG